MAQDAGYQRGDVPVISRHKRNAQSDLQRLFEAGHQFERGQRIDAQILEILAAILFVSGFLILGLFAENGFTRKRPKPWEVRRW